MPFIAITRDQKELGSILSLLFSLTNLRHVHVSQHWYSHILSSASLDLPNTQDHAGPIDVTLWVTTGPNGSPHDNYCRLSSCQRVLLFHELINYHDDKVRNGGMKTLCKFKFKKICPRFSFASFRGDTPFIPVLPLLGLQAATITSLVSIAKSDRADPSSS